MATYEAEARALERSYNEYVGWALQYGIKVYHPGTGGMMKSLGTLRDEVEAERMRRGDPGAPKRMADNVIRSRLDRTVQAYCTNGHAAILWGSTPMTALPGEQVRWWGAPFHCHCGALIYGGYPRRLSRVL